MHRPERIHATRGILCLTSGLEREIIQTIAARARAAQRETQNAAVRIRHATTPEEPLFALPPPALQRFARHAQRQANALTMAGRGRQTDRIIEITEIHEATRKEKGETGTKGVEKETRTARARWQRNARTRRSWYAGTREARTRQAEQKPNGRYSGSRPASERRLHVQQRQRKSRRQPGKSKTVTSAQKPRVKVRYA